MLRRRVGHLVALHVCFQTVALSEGFVTEGTLVRSLSVVGPHVNGQVCFTSACFPTNPADKRFDARVDGDMVVQISLALERPATVRAAVRRLSGVDPHVNRQRSLGGESFAAFTAVERLLVGVRPHVNLQLFARQEHLAAYVAEV